MAGSKLGPGRVGDGGLPRIANDLGQIQVIPEIDEENAVEMADHRLRKGAQVNTLRWWRQLGTGPHYTKFGRRLVTTLGEVKRWLAEQKRKGGIV